MAVDPNLFATRRLGFGLRTDEDLPGPPRDWAMAQVRSVPKLDFYGQGGKSIASVLPPDAMLSDYPQSCAHFGNEQKAELALLKKKAGQEEFWPVYAKYWNVPIWGAAMASTLSAINGPAPVFERFWQFWCNHFTASGVTGEGKALYGAHIQTIRTALTGSFEDLLMAAIGNPAVLYYLDNIYSAGPHSLKKTAMKNEFTFNENLGRELLELYSVSPEAGYTQADVIEAALILTGWTFSAGYKDAADSDGGAPPGLRFDNVLHEPGARHVMGKVYAEDNNDGGQLKALIADLAVHPSTAKFISKKLARAFVADDPPHDSVDRIAAVFTATKGDLIAIHSAVIDEALTVGRNFPKFARPSIWWQQAHKVVGADVDLDAPSADHLEIGLTSQYRDLGEEFGSPTQPSGWPDNEADWLSAATLDRRVRYAALISNLASGNAVTNIGEYIGRLAGTDSALAAACSGVSGSTQVVLLLASPQFLRI